MQLEPGGRRCGCGRRGCWETVAGLDALLDGRRRRARPGPRPQRSTSCGGWTCSTAGPRDGDRADAGRAGPDRGVARRRRRDPGQPVRPRAARARRLLRPRSGPGSPSPLARSLPGRVFAPAERRLPGRAVDARLHRGRPRRRARGPDPHLRRPHRRGLVPQPRPSRQEHRMTVEAPARPTRPARRPRRPAAGDARHPQALPRRARPRRRRPHRAGRRGALPARAERRRQVDADQDPVGLVPARRRARSAGRAGRWPSRRRSPRSRSGSRRSTRSWTWSPTSPSPRTSSSATSCPRGGFTRRRPGQPPGPGSCSPGWATRGIGVHRSVGSLSPASQQIVSMARALSHDTRLLILDEPSAVLDSGEVDEPVPGGPRTWSPQGVAVVYISHRLEEIRQIGDRITVLKDGASVATDLAGERDPHPRADPADDRPLHRVRLPAAEPQEPSTDAASPCSRSSTWSAAACSRR